MGGEGKLPITLCVIAQNEEVNLPDCLRSAPFASEIVVLDGGSEDRTCEIAAELGARVEQRAFDGWVSQKNAALALCTQPWVLALDADERVSPELAESLEALFGQGEPANDGYTVPRRAWHLGRWIRGGGWYPDRKLRLFRRERSRWDGQDPHDYIECDGSVAALDGDLLHYPYRDFRHHVTKMDRYTTAAAEAAHAKGRGMPVLRMLLSPPLRFFKSYVLRAGFRDGRAGVVLAGMASVYEFVRWSKVWELQRRDHEPKQ